jgi:DNA repair/transcription protein MET18/MMS19
MHYFDTKDAIEICRNVFMNADGFREYSAAARLEVYKLIDILMRWHRASLKNMGVQFVKEFLSLAESEKDPRCLMVYFSITLVILSEWDINGHVNDLWESLTRYFPITFRPKLDDPIGITAEDLKLRLRMCIAGTSEFAPLAFPYLIEKLDYQVTANVKVSGNSTWQLGYGLTLKSGTSCKQ